MLTYYMPTQIIAGKDCIRDHKHVFRGFGKRALIVTGKRSAKMCGAYDHVTQALEDQGIAYRLYDEVMSNPTVACVYEGARMARDMKAEMVIAIGGGSPLDAAKAMAVLAKQDIEETALFAGKYGEGVLPIIAIPTTAGTGSEATQYAILTNDALKTKSGLVSPGIFPKIAFLDATYTMGLPLHITINTAVDALSHSVEGMLSNRASVLSDAIAKVSIGSIMAILPVLKTAIEEKNAGRLTFDLREKLLIASMLGGMVIAQTGTTAVHAMGYALTYHKEVDHGKANGLLLPAYMKTLVATIPKRIDEILAAMKLDAIEAMEDQLVALMGEKTRLSREDVSYYSDQAMKTGNISNCLVKPTKEVLEQVYREALITL